MSLLSQNLQAFVSIVKNNTVHGAADELGLTQTAITQRIRALEKELNTTLFLRSRRGMQLTQEGEALLHYCRGAEELEGKALNQIIGSGDSKPVVVNISGPTSIMIARIINQCLSLYHKWPKLQLNFVLTDTDDRIQTVRSGKATMAIISPENVPNEMDSKMLKPEKYILVAPNSWKGRRINDILSNERIIDFYESDLTSINYLKKFNLLSGIKKPRLFVNNNEILIKLFRQGIGFGTLTQEIAKPYLESGELITLNGGAVMEEALALVWYPRPEMPNYLKAIITSIK